MSALSQYIDLYRNHRDAFHTGAPQVMNDLRGVALSRLEVASLPRKGSEDYEATDLSSVLADDFGVNVNRRDFDADVAQAFRCDVPNMSTNLYFCLNDRYHPSRTALLHDQGGVVVETFRQAAHKHPQLLAGHYGRLAGLDNPTVALNTLLAQDGLLVYIPDGVTAERPIQLVNILTAAMPIMAVRRLLIVVGREAHAKMLVCDHSQLTTTQALALQVVEIVAMENSTFDYYDLEESMATNRRISSLFVDQRAGSNVLVDGITLTNGFTRNNYRIEVNGEHADTQLMGMTVASGRQHVDTHTFIAHNAPRCHSNEMFKYVLNDEAVGAFAGRILVRPGCPRVEAYQGNRNLCASPEARMYTKPQLEIYTDDVKCSHGTTIGQLDEEALFYMRSRGIGIDVARTMLMQAFMSDVIDAVRMDLLRDRLRHLVEKRFNGSLASCANCVSSCKTPN
ncbi:MAG: Fe-S cluster assembly protein SufD [Muribaculaceae bacterium]|nr:Fe-S cluster assembly protein SufD [Muribaculaceae bacterium]